MRISKIIYICKKKLISWIEKVLHQLEKRNKEQDMAISIPMEIGGHLIRNIPIKEDSFRLIASHSHADARSYYLYAVVSEVLSACMSCMRVSSWVEESEEGIRYEYPKKNPGNETISAERVGHLIDEGIIQEFGVKFRKLQEHLCNLICFSETNRQEYFRLYFSAETLAEINYANQDIIEFFGKPIENFNGQSKDLLGLCQYLIKDLDQKKCWFLAPDLNFDSKLKQNIMSSFRQRFMKAIRSSNHGEKVVLGPTYGVGYGGSSKYAHALIRGSFKEYTLEDAKHAVEKIPLICLNILHRVSEIGKIDCPKKYNEIFEYAKSGEGATMGILSDIQGNFDIGDLVTADGSEVAEILDVHESSYGYKCYQVRYLINPKDNNIIEEWLPPRYVGAILVKKDNVRNLYIEKVAPLLGEKAPDWISKQSDDELYSQAKKAILGMAKDGHLKLFLKRRSKSK